MLFHIHHVQFAQVDPEDNGLHEEIAAEQMEPGAITLEENIDAEGLSNAWQKITSDLEQDPSWFKFTEDE